MSAELYSSLYGENAMQAQGQNVSQMLEIGYLNASEIYNNNQWWKK